VNEFARFMILAAGLAAPLMPNKEVSKGILNAVREAAERQGED
jgi:hypothetical protein